MRSARFSRWVRRCWARSDRLRRLCRREFRQLHRCRAGERIVAESMHGMFIESDAADDPFEPGLLLRPALGEYAYRLASLPQPVAFAARQYLEHWRFAGFFESFSRLARALPTGLFDNTGVGDYLTQAVPDATADQRLPPAHAQAVSGRDRHRHRRGGGVRRPRLGTRADSARRRGERRTARAFSPGRGRRRLYVDGALTKTLHASLALSAGAKLVLCVNPLVPFDARAAARHGRQASLDRRRRASVDHVADTANAYPFADASRDGPLSHGISRRRRLAVRARSRRCRNVLHQCVQLCSPPAVVRARLPEDARRSAASAWELGEALAVTASLSTRKRSPTNIARS